MAMMRLFSLKQDFLSPNISSDDLKKKIHSSDSPIIEHDFGTALGSVYFVRPDDMQMVEALAVELNKQPDARKTQSISAWISGGGPSLLSQPWSEAKPHHYLFTQRLSHAQDYIDATIEALRDFDVINRKKMRLSTLSTEPVYNALAKRLFSIDELSEDMIDAFKTFTSILTGYREETIAEGDVNPEEVFTSTSPVPGSWANFSNSVHDRLNATYYAKWGLDYAPQFEYQRYARDLYVYAAENLIADQMPVIRENIARYANNKKIDNLFALSIIEVIKQFYPQMKEDREELNRWLHYIIDNNEPLPTDDYILSLPSNIFAADNTKQLLSCIMHALATNEELLKSLRDVFAAYGLKDDLSNLYDVIKQDKNDNNLFHRIYLEGMRLRCIYPNLEKVKFSHVFYYHVTNPIKVGKTIIKTNSVVGIIYSLHLGSEEKFGANLAEFDPDRFIPRERAEIISGLFSHLPRRCPAYNANEYIAKAFVADLVMKYDFKLYSNPKEHNPSKILMEFSERELVNEPAPQPRI